jgi:hypothetical protein
LASHASLLFTRHTSRVQRLAQLRIEIAQPLKSPS